jgi:DNA-binding response OmpR family regulator
MSVGSHVSDVSRAPARILIVDDVRDSSELLQIMLNWEGFVTQIADTGEQALASVAAEPPDLVLLDLGLPGLNGCEVTSQIKGNIASRDIPVMIISGRGDDATRMRALNAGAVDFILKPVARADLCRRVRNILGRAAQSHG